VRVGWSSVSPWMRKYPVSEEAAMSTDLSSTLTVYI
jgi:hypothetical protein